MSNGYHGTCRFFGSTGCAFAKTNRNSPSTSLPGFRGYRVDRCRRKALRYCRSPGGSPCRPPLRAAAAGRLRNAGYAATLQVRGLQGGKRRSLRRTADGFPPEPDAGFHGRARQLLDLDRLFAERGIVVLHGFGGQGKTALAAHTARWLVRTGRFERAAFVSFENGGDLDLVLAELGNALVGDSFAAHEGDPIEAVAESLAEHPTLVVWDNFESVLPNGDAPLAADAMKALLDAGRRWFASEDQRLATRDSRRSALLVTTRDTSLPHNAFQPGGLCALYPLEGLTVVESMELARVLLADLGLPRPPRSGLEKLLGFLGGHPLSIRLVLPHLRETPDVDALIDEFDRLLPGFKRGEGVRRNQSLMDGAEHRPTLRSYSQPLFGWGSARDGLRHRCLGGGTREG